MVLVKYQDAGGRKIFTLKEIMNMITKSVFYVRDGQLVTQEIAFKREHIDEGEWFYSLANKLSECNCWRFWDVRYGWRISNN